MKLCATVNTMELQLLTRLSEKELNMKVLINMHAAAGAAGAAKWLTDWLLACIQLRETEQRNPVSQCDFFYNKIPGSHIKWRLLLSFLDFSIYFNFFSFMFNFFVSFFLSLSLKIYLYECELVWMYLFVVIIFCS